MSTLYRPISLLIACCIGLNAAGILMPSLNAKTATPSQPMTVSRQLLVKPKLEIYQWNEASFLKGQGMSKKRHFSKTGISLLRMDYSPMSIAQAKSALLKTGKYEWVEEDAAIEIAKSFLPNDPRFGGQWHLGDHGSRFALPNKGHSSISTAWQTAGTRSDVVIAVIDSGVDYRHPDLQSNMWRNPREIPGNGIDDDRNGYVDDIFGIHAEAGTSDPDDSEGHGTHVAGIIGARGNNNLGVTGVLWEAQIMALSASFFDPALGRWFLSTSGLVECLEYVHHARTVGNVNVRVVNCSWGSSTASVAIREAIEKLEEAEVLVVVSAGNGFLLRAGWDGVGQNNDSSGRPIYPASFELANILSVANSTRDNRLATSSNFGRRTTHLAAPGDAILSTVPGGGYRLMSGTSMAAPIVSASAALLWQMDSGLTVAQVKDALMKGVDVSDAFKAKLSSRGRLNLAKSVNSIANRPRIQHPLPGVPAEPNPLRNAPNYEVLFTWDPGTQSVQNWRLQVGSTPGGSEYLDSGLLSADHRGIVATHLPENGSTLHSTLSWMRNGIWESRSYDSFITRNNEPTIQVPSPGSVLDGSTVVFAFSNFGHPVTSWTLHVGSEPFANDLFSSVNMPADAVACWVDHLPTDGRSLWVTLLWEVQPGYNRISSGGRTYEFKAKFQ